MVFFSPSVQQKELAKKHEKLVVLLNHAMGKKAIASIYINETYTKISLEKEEIRLKRRSIQGKEAIIDKDKGEYLKAKKRLSGQVSGMIYFLWYRIIQNLKQEMGNNLFVLQAS